jgi:hypothetical protein
LDIFITEIYIKYNTFYIYIIHTHTHIHTMEIDPYPVNDDLTATTDPEPDVSHTLSDSSPYNYDIVITYKMIDDLDDQDTLFRLQFLQVFGINTDEYQPDIVSAGIDALFERFRDNEDIREILSCHPLYNCSITQEIITPDADDADDADNADDTPAITIVKPVEDNSEMIFCMMFSFQTFDLFHTCLQNAHYDREITREMKDEIIELNRQMF